MHKLNDSSMTKKRDGKGHGNGNAEENRERRERKYSS